MSYANLNRYQNDEVIRMPLFPRISTGEVPRGQWLRVNSRSAAVFKRAGILAARQFRAEGNYDSPILYDVAGYSSDRLIVLTYIPHWAHTVYKPGERFTEAPAWAFVNTYSSRFHSITDLAVVWVHPHYRNKGVMSKAFPKLYPVLDDPFTIQWPISKAMSAVISKHGTLEDTGWHPLFTRFEQALEDKVS